MWYTTFQRKGSNRPENASYRSGQADQSATLQPQAQRIQVRPSHFAVDGDSGPIEIRLKWPPDRPGADGAAVSPVVAETVRVI
eukprot:765309-Hanusia_phi.AAC.1